MTDVIYGFGILLTFLLGVWNIVNNYRTNRRTTFINTVTSERVKWIENLRQNISTFCGVIYTFSASASKLEEEEKKTIRREVDKLRHLIRLQLNPADKHDQDIEGLIRTIPDLTNPSQFESLKTELDKLIIETQQLLKEEWEKVKLEAKRGDIRDNENYLDILFDSVNTWCLRKLPTGRTSPHYSRAG